MQLARHGKKPIPTLNLLGRDRFDSVHIHRPNVEANHPHNTSSPSWLLNINEFPNIQALIHLMDKICVYMPICTDIYIYIYIFETLCKLTRFRFRLSNSESWTIVAEVSPRGNEKLGTRRIGASPIPQPTIDCRYCQQLMWRRRASDKAITNHLLKPQSPCFEDPPPHPYTHMCFDYSCADKEQHRCTEAVFHVLHCHGLCLLRHTNTQTHLH